MCQHYRKPHQLWARWFDLALINRIKKIDRWDVDDTSLRHRFLEFDRSSEVLSHFRAVASFNDNRGVIHPIGGTTNVGWVTVMRLDKDQLKVLGHRIEQNSAWGTITREVGAASG